MNDILFQAVDGAGAEESFDNRLNLVAELAEWVNMHDWHEPHAHGLPGGRQSCAKCVRGTKGTDKELYYCNKNFPRSRVEPGTARLEEDPRRSSVFRLWLARNCKFMNNYHPALILALLANMDIQAITTKWGVAEYITKYITKFTGAATGTPMQMAERAFDDALEKAQTAGKGALSAVAKFYNSQVAPGLISQLEVSHYLWDFPSFLCSRHITALKIDSEVRLLRDPEQIRQDLARAAKSGKKVRLTHLKPVEVPCAHCSGPRATCPFSTPGVQRS